VAATPGVRAIILAAGVGRRLGALTVNRPKCLLPLATESLLERQLRLLSAVDISDVVVVVGFQQDHIASRFAGRVTLCRNPDYLTMGSVHSLQVAAEFLSGNVVILNSDLVFGRPMLDGLLAANGAFTLVLHPGQRHTAGVGARVSGDQVLDVGRHVRPSISAGAFSGAAPVRSDGIQDFRKAVVHSDPYLKAAGWSMAFASLIRDGHRVDACRYAGPAFDVNSVTAYRAAKAWAASEFGDPAAH
jgi:choline kinase